MKTPQTEIPMKQWVAETAMREKVKPNTIWVRIGRHGWHGPPRRVVNRRVIFVENRAPEIPA